MKVLVPTEGSEFSKAAIEKCCKMFDDSETTEIEVFSAAEPWFTPPGPFDASYDYMVELDAVELKKANDAVDQAAADIGNSFPDLATRLTTKVVKGSPKQAIVDEAENWGADMIIMGSRGYGFWRRALHGSVSESVVRHAPCSVLVVRAPNITAFHPVGRS